MPIVPPVFPPDNTMPLVVGYYYQVGTGDVWVTITSIVDGVVHARGIGTTVADIIEPTWKFDDLMGSYLVKP